MHRAIEGCSARPRVQHCAVLPEQHTAAREVDPEFLLDRRESALRLGLIKPGTLQTLTTLSRIEPKWTYHDFIESHPKSAAYHAEEALAAGGSS
jgi:hypothetical protein